MSGAAAIREWRENPPKMVFDLFGVTPDAWQADVLQAWADPNRRRIAMQACAGPGKSAVLAWCGWNFLLCYADQDAHPNGAAVSITGENLRTGLWKELAIWRNKSQLLQKAFEHTTAEIFNRQHPKTWFLSARSFPKKANAEEIGATLSGLHSPFIAYFIDESGGIHPAIGRAAEQGLGNCRWGKIATAGNPLSLESLLYVCVTKLRNQWFVVCISGDPEDPKRSSRIDIEWARQQIQAYGRDNPWVMIYILGRFPPASVNALIGPDDCDAATKRQPREDQYSWAPRILGVDCARFGDDATVLVERQGLVCSPFTVLRNVRTEEIGGRVLRSRAERNIAATFIDSAMGGGVVDYCRLLGHEIVEVAFGGKAKDPRYYNRRTEMAFTACDFIKSGAMIPNDPEFIAELCAHTYTFKGDQMLLEPKELVKAKIGRSPDRFDAYLLTHAEHVAVDDSIENYLRYPGLRSSENVGRAVTDREE